MSYLPTFVLNFSNIVRIINQSKIYAYFFNSLSALKLVSLTNTIFHVKYSETTVCNLYKKPNLQDNHKHSKKKNL